MVGTARLVAVLLPSRGEPVDLQVPADEELRVGAGRERQRVATIKRGAELDSGEGIGLTLEEVKDLVQRLQAIVAAEQAREVEAANASCAACGERFLATVRRASCIGPPSASSSSAARGCTRSAGAAPGHTAGTRSIRWRWPWRSAPTPSCCTCRPAGRASCSYDRAARLLQDLLPLGASPASSSIKAQVRKAGEAMATHVYESGEHFFDEQPLNLPERPRQQAAHVLELDAAYVRAVAEKCQGRNSFGIITGRLIILTRSTGCCPASCRTKGLRRCAFFAWAGRAG